MQPLPYPNRLVRKVATASVDSAFLPDLGALRMDLAPSSWEVAEAVALVAASASPESTPRLSTERWLTTFPTAKPMRRELKRTEDTAPERCDSGEPHLWRTPEPPSEAGGQCGSSRRA
jgi:hypothetical protein